MMTYNTPSDDESMTTRNIYVNTIISSCCTPSIVMYESESESKPKKRGRKPLSEEERAANRCIVNRRTVKKWRAENKDKVALYNKKYAENNSLEKVVCECGAITCKIGIPRHQKTKKHLKRMKGLEQI